MKPKSIYLDAGNDELKILFIVPENPKKAIYATAILEKIFTLYPRAKITILGKMPAVSLFGATPNTDKILIVEKAYYLDAIKKVLSSKWDIIIDAETGATSVDKIYAGGDVAPTGSSTAINAMGAGKRAAKAINEYLAKI